MSHSTRYDLEKEERELLQMGGCRKSVWDRPALIIVAGPPGSGKSTLVRALADEHWLNPVSAYVEQPNANPFLGDFRNATNFEAGHSQKWFLTQYKIFADEVRGVNSIVLDQDPRAVVLVYSKHFLSKGMIQLNEYRDHLNLCRDIMISDLIGPRFPCLVVLNCSQITVAERLRNRDLGTVLSSTTLLDLLPQFRKLCDQLAQIHHPYSFEFDTERVSTGQIVAVLKNKFLSLRDVERGNS